MTALIALLVGLTVFVAVPGMAHTSQREVHDSSNEMTTSELIEAIRMCVQSGLTLASSFSLLVRCGFSHPLIRQTQSNISVGLPVLHGLPQVASDYSIQLLISLLERNTRTGSSIDQSLSVLSHQIRADVHAQRIKRIRAVAVKSVMPLGLCFLPAFILLGVVPIAMSLGSSFLN